jgi:hypothetical protein
MVFIGSGYSVASGMPGNVLLAFGLPGASESSPAAVDVGQERRQ